MARRRKTTHPSDPMEIARRRAADRERGRDPASWGIDVDALALAVNADVELRGDAAGRGARASRKDVFALLHARGKLSAQAHDAVRRLQDDIAVLHRTGAGALDFTPRVDASRRPGGFSEQRLRAGARIEAVLRLSGAASARLLCALCEADVVLGAHSDWRAVVARQTGETLADAQGATLRLACENLAGAYLSLRRDRRDEGEGS